MSEDNYTEAEALSDQYDEYDAIADALSDVRCSIDLYNLNKKTKVGTVCICPTCRCKFTKENYQQAFCKRRMKNKQSRCKVEYHNRNQYWSKHV